MITITEQSFAPSEALSTFSEKHPGAGGIVSFTGAVRPSSAQGAVETLYLQAYAPMTQRGIEQAVAKAYERWPLTGLRIIHRIGHMAPTDAIVFVAAAANHRRDAFEAVDFLMDYLKTEAIFWKKETHTSGTAWIEPRSQDHADAKRWQQNKEA